MEWCLSVVVLLSLSRCSCSIVVPPQPPDLSLRSCTFHDDCLELRCCKENLAEPGEPIRLSPQGVCYKENLFRECYPASEGGCVLQSNGTYLCKGECRAGKQICEGGVWTACVDVVLPKPVQGRPLCNEKDDNVVLDR